MLCVCPQVNGTEIEYEFEEITLERVSISTASRWIIHLGTFAAKEQKNKCREGRLCNCFVFQKNEYIDRTFSAGLGVKHCRDVLKICGSLVCETTLK